MTRLPAADPVAVQAWCRALFAQLVECGVNHVAASPGSRSTPMTVAADRTPGLEMSMHLDERSGGFFALGLARATDRPVALLCTSGTAAANYLPAVIEAFHSGVPLIVLTSDRPAELQGVGAPQTIDQDGIYGTHVRWATTTAVAGSEPARRHQWHIKPWCEQPGRPLARCTSTCRYANRWSPPRAILHRLA